MRAESIEQIREHLARGGKALCYMTENGCRNVIKVGHSHVLIQSGPSTSLIAFTHDLVDHWELLPIEEEVDDDSHLKPCPFCGGDADSMTYCGNDTIFCQTCPAMMGGEESRATREELAKAWNTRPIEEEKFPMWRDACTLRIGTEKPIKRKPVQILIDGNDTGAGERIRQSLLFGHYPAMNDLRDWWQATTGERIEWGRRCNYCECSGKQTSFTTLEKIECCGCNGSGYTVRPTWMGDKATGAQQDGQ